MKIDAVLGVKGIGFAGAIAEIEKFVDELDTISSKNIRKYCGDNIRKAEKMDLE